MKAAVVYGNGQIDVKSVPDLKPGPYQALVKIKACSVCNGTDRMILDGKLSKSMKYPAVLGHESVGEVIETGKKVTGYSKGDMVFRAGAVYEKETGLSSFWGGFAEYGLVSDYNAMISDGKKPSPMAIKQQVIHQDIDPVDATVLVTYKETMDWLHRFGLKEGQSVLVWGTGPVGISFTRNAKILGAYPVITAGRRNSALEYAKTAGADEVLNINDKNTADFIMDKTNGNGVDRAVVAVGDYSLIEKSIPLVCPDGEIGMYGMVHGGYTMDISKLKRRSVRFIRPCEETAHREITEYARMGFIKPRNEITHVIPLNEIETGFRYIKEKKALKVVVKI